MSAQSAVDLLATMHVINGFLLFYVHSSARCVGRFVQLPNYCYGSVLNSEINEEPQNDGKRGDLLVQCE